MCVRLNLKFKLVWLGLVPIMLIIVIEFNTKSIIQWTSLKPNKILEVEKKIAQVWHTNIIWYFTLRHKTTRILCDLEKYLAIILNEHYFMQQNHINFWLLFFDHHGRWWMQMFISWNKTNVGMSFGFEI